MRIGNKEFVLGKRTYIMGILNVTPDSFSDGGRFNKKDDAIRHAVKMVEQGADIIDVGGESTRPNHTPVSEEEETERVAGVITAIKSEIDVPISIDTYKSGVAEIAVQEGASLINDVWGFKRTAGIAGVAAKYGVACCLMHNRDNTLYTDIIDDMITDLQESIDIALTAGVERDRIIIDPGIGFAKDAEQNIAVMSRLEELSRLGCPVLLGTSRKSFIGKILDLPPELRVEGTVATSVIGIMKGCDFIRVHDVLENKRACMVADAILRKR